MYLLLELLPISQNTTKSTNNHLVHLYMNRNQVHITEHSLNRSCYPESVLAESCVGTDGRMVPVGHRQALRRRAHRLFDEGGGGMVWTNP